ncbi:hypothetical protein AAHA92_02824 [Salvia divinorum]|uniref:Uncharacterized protein n=1 Tax=Salvia divinorum TaxID=28513 RepID=A0ABD1IFY5_SALDI
MAAKSQPLHNFSLPHLKWAHKNSAAPHNRRRDSADHDPESDPKQQQPAEDESGEARPWTLRPRKEAIKAASTSERETVIDGSNNGLKAKRKVWISLSREEIEEDVYAFTGGKPSRRPKKWPKNVQKQLTGVFPGLYLAGVAADSYRL